MPACRRPTRLAAGVIVLSALPRLAGAETCAYSDFDTFLQAFSADPALQQQYSADPLPMSWLDMEAEPEPAEVSEDRPHSELNWPVVVDVTTAGTDFTAEITAPDETSRTVTVNGTDNGLSEIYHFRAAPCWTLIRVESNST